MFYEIEPSWTEIKLYVASKEARFFFWEDMVPE
jgi:hypothetical protein